MNEQVVSLYFYYKNIQNKNKAIIPYLYLVYWSSCLQSKKPVTLVQVTQHIQKKNRCVTARSLKVVKECIYNLL